MTPHQINEIYNKILKIEYVNGIVWSPDSIAIIVASNIGQYRYETSPIRKKELYFKLITFLIEP